MQENFEIIARAVVVNRGKILVCNAYGHTNFFLPGGHVEFSESAEKALKRELVEELGASLKSSKYIGVVENVYTAQGKKHHEVNLVFAVSLRSFRVESLEKHLAFKWVSLSEFESIQLLPKAMQKAVARWLKYKKPFWGSEV